ncbi:hypothetical protein QTP88_021573 [Uroleucon formosanum]
MKTCLANILEKEKVILETKEEINALGVSSTMTTNDISALRKYAVPVYRVRRQFLPMNSTCIADIHSAKNAVSTLTANDEEFLMVRNYIRKTKRHSWTEESMKNAIMVCVNKAMEYKKAALVFDVPQSTLERRVKVYLESE